MEEYFMIFLVGNIFISVFIGLFLLAEKIWYKRLYGRQRFNLWKCVFPLFLMPFLCMSGICSFDFLSFMDVFGMKEYIQDAGRGITRISNAFALSGKENLTGINSNAISISDRRTWGVAGMLCVVWLTGAGIFFVRFLFSDYLLYRLRISSLSVEDKKLLMIYRGCMDTVQIKKQIPVRTTINLKTPVSVGVIKPMVLFPLSFPVKMEEEEIRYMMLHELIHCKYKDALSNYMMCIFVVVYWFNPFVWIAAGKIRLEREVACDSGVLALLEKEEYADYGNTLLKVTRNRKNIGFSVGLGMGGEIKHTRRRITEIAAFGRRPAMQKRLGFFVTSLVLVFLALTFLFMNFSAMQTSPMQAAVNGNNRYDFMAGGNQIREVNLENKFEGFEGSFVLYDESRAEYTIYDEEQAKKRVDPDSTYKIYDALMGLEYRFISEENSGMEWNGQNYPFETWERDQTLRSAMNDSVNWYFQEIDKKAGKENTLKFFRRIGYGNQEIGDDLSLYWLDGSLKISPIEQVEMLRKLYRNEFSFSENNVEFVKNTLLLKKERDFCLYGKTGTGKVEEKNVNGWFVGFVEKSGSVYYFCTNIHSEDGADGSTAAWITREILQELLVI